MSLLNINKWPSSPLFAFLWLVIALFFYYGSDGSSMSYHNSMTWLALVSYIFSLACWLIRGNRMFSLFTLFVVYAIFSNLGQSLLYSFGLEIPLSKLYLNYSTQSLCTMLKYQYLCAAGFYFGVCMYLRFSYRNVTQYSVSDYYLNINPSKSHTTLDSFLLVLLYVCLIAVFYFTIYQLIMRQSMSYDELYESRDLLHGPFVFGSIVLGLYFIFTKRHVSIVLLFWTWYILAYFMAGTRSMAIIYVGVLFLTLPIVKPNWFGRKTSYLWILVGVMGIAGLSVISELRTGTLGEMSSSSEMEMGMALFNSVAEMGASEYPTMITIDEIKMGFPHSQTILYHLLLGFFPASVLNLVVPSNWTIQLGTWATEAVASDYNELGYSWIAESYMNYGSFGWLFIAIYGWFIVMAENYSLRRIKNGQYLLALCLIALLCRQIFFARGQISLCLPFYRNSIYLLIISLIFYHPIQKRRKIKL